MAGIEIYDGPVVIKNNRPEKAEETNAEGREKTLSMQILKRHNKDTGDKKLHISFDAMISHDITYVGIIQTARASGMTEFPIPYAMTNCHNSLCAVGGTINEDDHAFGLSAAKKYGGIYVPANQAVIHQFAREKLAGCGKMVLGSDSHTRYGCLGALGVGEGGGELAKQLLKNTWDIDEPEIVLCWITGSVPHGIGPHDVALDLVRKTFPSGFVKNKILEFAGPGIEKLSMDFRMGVDVMTTETSCLSSVWITDEKVKEFFEAVKRPEEYKQLMIEEGAYYDSMVMINLDEMESMIALPFHPSNAYTIHELQKNPEKILKDAEQQCNAQIKGDEKLDLLRNIGPDGKIRCEQGVIVGCSGGMYENISEASDILKDKSIGDGYFDMSVYASSAPVNLAIIKDGIAEELLKSGAVLKPSFCGPCFGAGDTPANNTLSIRHATRNFANREGSKPANNQIAAVALMDARSIAATAVNKGVLTAATDIEYEISPRTYKYDDTIYEKRVYYGFGKANPDAELRLGPNIKDWPKMPELSKNLLVKLCAVIHDDVTTTDELIPSGETSSYRSNPIALSEFALSRRAPDYVEKSKAVRALEEKREQGEADSDTKNVLDIFGAAKEDTTIGSCIYANRPGDGSAREQAASCQKVLGGFANIARQYATKRYRSNCINWGIIPFTFEEDFEYETGDWIFVSEVKEKILKGTEEFKALVLKQDGGIEEVLLKCAGLSDDEKQIVTDGCLMNYYAKKIME